MKRYFSPEEKCRIIRLVKKRITGRVDGEQSAGILLCENVLRATEAIHGREYTFEECIPEHQLLREAWERDGRCIVSDGIWWYEEDLESRVKFLDELHDMLYVNPNQTKLFEI